MMKNKYLIYAGLFFAFILSNILQTQHFYNHVKDDSYNKAKEINYTINTYADLCLKNNSKSECLKKINDFVEFYPKQYYGFQINEIKKNTTNILFDNRRYKDDERSKTVEFQTEIKALNKPITIVINSVPNILMAVFHGVTFSLFDGRKFSWYTVKGKSLNSTIFFIFFIALFFSIRKSSQLQKNIDQYDKNIIQLNKATQRERNQKIEFEIKINKLENKVRGEQALEGDLQEEFLKIEKEYSEKQLLLKEEKESLEFEIKNTIIPSKNRIIELEKTKKEYKNILSLWVNADAKHKKEVEKQIDTQLPFVMSQAFVAFEKIINQKISKKDLKEKKLNTLSQKARHCYKGLIPNYISKIIKARNKFVHEGALPNDEIIESVFSFLEENKVFRFFNYAYPKSFLELKNIHEKSQNRKIYQALNGGIKILTTDKELNQYLWSFGKMHHDKMKFACKKLLEKVKIEGKYKIQIIDYGCGQGLASIVLLNNLKRQNFPIDKINKITLIEPSHIALGRAKKFLHTLEVGAINKKLDEIIPKDLKTDKQAVKFHLFSNILDIGDKEFDIEKIANKIIESQKGTNYFICVSPKEYDKLSRFMKFFNNYELIDSGNEIFYSPKSKMVYNIFKVELQ